MKQFLLILFCLSVSFAKAENPNERIAVMNQLMSVNQEWIKQPEFNKILNEIQIPANCSYTDLISIHLRLVEKTLRTRNLFSLSAEQKHNRLSLLDKLNSYWKNKIFPINDYANYKTPVFIDKTGTHCAVGYLMQQSGAEKLAEEINNKQKFAYISEIKISGVTAWATENGFALEELAWVQPGYYPYTPTTSLDSGLNATVNVIAPNESGGVVYVGGAFTKSISGVSCNHVAAWVNGVAGWDWVPLGTGVGGDVFALLLHNNQLIVGGDFKEAGEKAAPHVALYDLYTNQWQTMGSLNNTVRALALYNGEIYAAGDFAGGVTKWNGTSWETINAGLTGSVRTLEVWNSLLVIGGDFELNTGALRKNAVAYDGTQMVLLGFGTKTPVNDFEIFNGDLYAGCDYADKGDTCAVAKYESGDWKTVLKDSVSSFYLLHIRSIRQLKSHNNSMYIAGDFSASAGMIGGNNLMMTDNSFKSVAPVLLTDSTINSLALLGNDIYFGGDFTKNYSWGPSSPGLNHIGTFKAVITNVIRPENNSGIKIYPNPSGNTITVSVNKSEDLQQIRIYNSLSQLVYHKDFYSENEIQVPVTELPAGIYSMVLSSDEKRVTGKFVVRH